VSSTTPREKSGYAIGVLQTASSSGTVIGPLVGGSLADMFGYRPLFFVVAIICTISGIVVIKFVQESTEKKISSVSLNSMIENYRYALRSKTIRVALVLILISQAAILMIQPVFSLYIDSFEINKEYLATIAGAIFSTAGLCMVISAPWWGKRNDSKSYKKTLTITIIGAAAAYAAQGLVTQAYQLIFLRALQGLFMGGLLPTLYSYVIKNTISEQRGGIIGIASSFNILAAMIGPPLGGYIAAYVGLRQNFFITGGILFSAAIVVRLFFIDMRGSDKLHAASAKEIAEAEILETTS
jgi:MFS family permease